MATLIANTSFSYKSTSFTRGQQYDTVDPRTNEANTAVPHLFYATGGTKTAKETFVFKDTRAGGIERFVYKGELIPSGDAAVTAAPGDFV